MEEIGLREKVYNGMEAFIMEKVVMRDSPGPFFKWLFKLPILSYKLGMGWMIGKSVLLLSTLGRKTGKRRHTPPEYVYDEENDPFRVAAGWGGCTDRYRNLLKNPRVQVQVGRRKFQAIAERVRDEEVAKYMVHFSGRHPRMDRVWGRWSDKPLDGTLASYVHAVQLFPSVWLKPVEQ